jgi:hypothetical protein
VDNKKCTKCGEEKPLDQFSKGKYRCKACLKIDNANDPHKSERAKRYRQSEGGKKKEAERRKTRREYYQKYVPIYRKERGYAEIEKERHKTRAIKQREEMQLKCIVCGELVMDLTRTKTCTIECGVIHERKLNRDFFYRHHQANLNKQKQIYISNWQQPQPFECKHCGKLHQPEYGDKRTEFCSARCSRADQSGKNNKKRAEKFGVGYEPVNPLKVFMRDGWKCQLCHRRLKKEDRGTIKKRAPELDHIIPLSKGGDHSYINTQCACRQCNSDKGATERGQLRLFG